MKTLLSTSIILALSSVSVAAHSAPHDDGNWIESYADPNYGSTLEQFTDLDNNSRWYYNLRLQGTASAGESLDTNANKIEASLRLRGKTMFTDDLGFMGDFWLKARENYNQQDGVTTNAYDDLDEDAAWENLIFGIESNKYGAIAYAKHTSNWAIFAADMGMHGQFNIQGEAGGKNAGKIIYKNFFANNLFVHTSYDRNSDIVGLDIGYQTANIYPFYPDSYGIYASVHNGQPSLNNGYQKTIIGNVDPSKDIKSDTDLNRHSEDLYTYSISGYKQFGMNGRFGSVLAYSERDDGETKREIRARGYTKGGLGFSASATYQYFPDNIQGWGAAVTASHDEFSDQFVPQVYYWFHPQMRMWAGHVFTSHGEESTQIEFQIDY
ncbi:hypothetical protein ACFODT_03750 [Vibrio zhugei]|uniref:Porin n=1 Tax=Vibrio zhugei TaxID=2479546 RepID=A0ABV7C814_9VIBR|nr:hypothetical protein [Vibrio zhugei]